MTDTPTDAGLRIQHALEKAIHSPLKRRKKRRQTTLPSDILLGGAATNITRSSPFIDCFWSRVALTQKLRQVVTLR